jgi:hypothetical protein
MSHKTQRQQDRQDVKYQLSFEQLEELREFNRLSKSLFLIQSLVEKNTLVVPDGQAEAKKWKAITDLVEQEKQNTMGVFLAQKGWQPNEKVTINIGTGRITEIPDEPKPAEPQ